MKSFLTPIKRKRYDQFGMAGVEGNMGRGKQDMN
jgi:DnaJ-class molecular chaperone